MEVSLEMKYEKMTWTYMMIWMTSAALEMNYRGKTPRKAWVIARIVAVPAGTQVGRLCPRKDESLSNTFDVYICISLVC